MVGNRWYRTDLHLHSPASDCFRDKDKVTAEMWIKECKNKGLDCVALTDHNSGNNIDDYKKIAEKYGLILFPGVEVTCGESGTHLLILFDLEDGTDTVNDFLLKIGIDRNSFGCSKPGTKKGVLEVIRKALEENKLVIPAHIDEYNGICDLDNTFLDSIINNTEITAAQFVQKEFYDLTRDTVSVKKVIRDSIYPKVKERYTDSLSFDRIDQWFKTAQKLYNSKKFSCLTFSDNPHAPGDSQHGLWGIGNRFTYIKMSETPSLSSLRDALRFGDLRVKCDFIDDFKANTNKNIFLEKLIIKNTTQNKNDIIIDFSQDLTTIIGSRGTGKSFVTKLLAYVLRKEKSLEQYKDVFEDYKNFAKKEDRRSGVLTVNSEVILYLQYDGNKYEIIRNINNSKNAINRILEDDTRIQEDDIRLESISQNIDIYLQKQIFEMSKDQTNIREFLDSYCLDEIEPIRNKITVIETKIKKINLENITKKADISKEGILRLEIKDLEDKVNRLSNPAFNKTINENRNAKQEEDAVNSDIDKLKIYVQTLRNTIIDQSDILEVGDKIPKSLYKYRENLKDKLLSYQTKINDYLNEVEKEIKLYSEQINNSEWKKNILQKFEEFKVLESSKLNMDLDQIESLSKVTEKLERKRRQLEEINSSKKLVENNNELIESELTNINKLYQDIYECRKKFVENYFEGIKVRINRNADFYSYVEKLRELLGKKDVFKEQFENLKNSLEENKISYVNIYKEISKVIEGKTSKLFTDKQLCRSLKTLNSDRILEIRLLIPEDKITIKLNVSGREVELTNASAGQKTSAMLTMILALGNKALVMDQPEDDLDSQLINSLIVKNIIMKKNTRQIVVVTHNANIPVNGDSEWVVAMGDTKDLSMEVSDSIDSNEIKGKICSIMEGGTEAFNNRAIRYGFKK